MNFQKKKKKVRRQSSLFGGTLKRPKGFFFFFQILISLHFGSNLFLKVPRPKYKYAKYIYKIKQVLVPFVEFGKKN